MAVGGAGGCNAPLLAREIFVSTSHTLELAVSRIWVRVLRLLTSFAAGPFPKRACDMHTRHMRENTAQAPTRSTIKQGFPFPGPFGAVGRAGMQKKMSNPLCGLFRLIRMLKGARGGFY